MVLVAFFFFGCLGNIKCHTIASGSFYCISCKWCVFRHMCNERVLEHDWEPNSSFFAIGTHRWWRPERTRQRSTRLENYTAQQLRERHSSFLSSMTSARLTPCTSFLSRWNFHPWSALRGTHVYNTVFFFSWPIFSFSLCCPFSFSLDETLNFSSKKPFFNLI